MTSKRTPTKHEVIEQIVGVARLTPMGEALDELEQALSPHDLVMSTRAAALIIAAVPTDDRYTAPQVGFAMLKLALGGYAMHLSDYRIAPPDCVDPRTPGRTRD